MFFLVSYSLSNLLQIPSMSLNVSQYSQGLSMQLGPMSRCCNRDPKQRLKQDSLFPFHVDSQSGTVALLQEVARLPLICFLHYRLSVALVRRAQKDPFPYWHCSHQGGQKKRAGNIAFTGGPGSAGCTCYLCSHPIGQNRGHTQLIGGLERVLFLTSMCQINIAGSIIMGNRYWGTTANYCLYLTLGTIAGYPHPLLFSQDKFLVGKLFQRISIFKFPKSHSHFFPFLQKVICKYFRSPSFKRGPACMGGKHR